MKVELKGTIRLGDVLKTGRRVQNGQYIAANELIRRLFVEGEHGAVLADEVGLGKTYVSLGVVAWLLAERPSSRVLILTNSRTMAKAWATRWEHQIGLEGKPSCDLAWDYEHYDQLLQSRSNRLVVASYEALKSFRHTNWTIARASLAAWLFQPRHRRGTRFSRSVRRRLLRGLGVRSNARIQDLGRSPPSSEARGFWKRNFDVERNDWRDPDAVQGELDELELRWKGFAGGRRPVFDLAVIDEAHRTEGWRRNWALELLLKNRTQKLLFVTATPFALDVRQLEDLFRKFAWAKGADAARLESEIAQLRLGDFERAVGSGEPYPAQADLEERLRRWILRRTWTEESQTATVSRRRVCWRAEPDSATGALATMALERAIAQLLQDGGRTHISQRRVSLCSSWASARELFESSPFRGPAGQWARRALTFLSAAPEDSPKIQLAVARIAAAVRRGEKVLVFSERKATLGLMERLLRRELADLEATARRNADRLVRRAGGSGVPKGLMRAVAGATPGERIDLVKAVRLARRWQRRDLEELDPDEAFGARQQIRSVERFDGDHGDDATRHRFNLPGTPWVLLCSKKAQESIDLHYECGRVVLLEPIWNPAEREQRIGRIQRIGSRFRQIEVVDVYTKGTYEEQIFERAEKRARMMAALLGAGRWLDEEQELADYDQYRINLSPRRDL